MRRVIAVVRLLCCLAFGASTRRRARVTLVVPQFEIPFREVWALEGHSRRNRVTAADILPLDIRCSPMGFPLPPQ
jgi:hypothetical protein